MSYFGYNID
jgi:hypothetical protein